MALLPAFLLPTKSPFEPSSTVYTLIYHPLTTLFTFLHNVLLLIRGKPYSPPPNATPLRVVCISDTHSKIPSVPTGDLLIHAGDLTNDGTASDIQQQINWLKTLQRTSSQPNGFQQIVVVCGNHDSYFDERSRSVHDRKMKSNLDWGSIHYLEHSSISLTFPSSNSRTLNIYGAPQIPKCGGKEFAFQYLRGQDAWSNTIPDAVDILVTHNPPKYHLDIPENGGQGCEWLLKEVWRVKPTLHIFGHVHAGYGLENVWWDKSQQKFEQLREKAFSHRRAFPFFEVLDFRIWILGMRLVYECTKGALWTKVWGGTAQGGYMINAALTYRSTGKLGNRPLVVVI